MCEALEQGQGTFNPALHLPDSGPGPGPFDWGGEERGKGKGESADGVQALDWKSIASACGTTPGAASKRYSRMKTAWEDDSPCPSAAGGGATAPATPNKTPAATSAANTPTPKRKRAPATKHESKQVGVEKYHTDSDDASEDASPSPKKRVRARLPARAPVRKSTVKSELDADAGIDALPTPASSTTVQHQKRNQNQHQNKNQDSAFQGFATDGEHTFQGFRHREEVEKGAEGKGKGKGEGEEWYESSEYLDGGVNECKSSSSFFSGMGILVWDGWVEKED